MIVSTDQLATNYTCSATDLVGNTGGPVTATVKCDATAPTVALAGSPADTANYYYGAVPPRQRVPLATPHPT